MSQKGKSARTVVREELEAARERMMIVLEQKMFEYEEKLHLSKKEGEQKQRVLDFLQNQIPNTLEVRSGSQPK